MQRSPKLLGLLAVGTIAFNAAAIYDMRGFPYESGGELFIAATFGQLSAFCVWVMFADLQFATKVLLPASAALIATLLTTFVLGANVLFDALAIFGCYVGLLMMVLWLLERAPYFRRHTNRSASIDWQFSLKQLLILTAIAAPLFALVGKAAFLQSIVLSALVLFAESIVITLIAIFAMTMPYRWVYRLAFALGATFLAAFVASLAVDTIALPIGLIEAIVLFAWLELGQLVPSRPAEVTESHAVGPSPT